MLGMDAGTPPEQTRGDDARIIEDQEFVAAEERGKFRELPVFKDSRRTIEHEHARGLATAEGPLRDLLPREKVIEVL